MDNVKWTPQDVSVYVHACVRECLCVYVCENK